VEIAAVVAACGGIRFCSPVFGFELCPIFSGEDGRSLPQAAQAWNMAPATRTRQAEHHQILASPDGAEQKQIPFRNRIPASGSIGETPFHCSRLTGTMEVADRRRVAWMSTDERVTISVASGLSLILLFPAPLVDIMQETLERAYGQKFTEGQGKHP
jgi:hypothetical protein